MPPAKLHFFHIPKTGGTSLRLALESAYAPEEVIAVKDEWDFEARSRKVALDLAPVRCFAGHFRRDQFDALKIVTGEDWLTVTCMRDPESQLLSHFYMIKWLESHQQHEAVKELSLLEALELPDLRTLLSDFQTRWTLGAAENLYYRWMPLESAELRRAAEERLAGFFKEGCAVAGTTERLYLTYLLICAAAGLPPQESLGQYNENRLQTKSRHYEELDDPETLAAIRSMVRRDQTFYSLCEERLRDDALSLCERLNQRDVGETLFSSSPAEREAAETALYRRMKEALTA